MSIRYTNTIAAGGEFHIVGRLIRPDMNVNFYFIPAVRPLDIYIYDADSLTGFVVENYLGILIFFLFVTIALLVVSIVFRPGEKPAENKEAVK